MRRRLEQLLNESFEYDPPSLAVEPSSIEMEVKEREILRGSVLVSHPEGKKCKGFVYSSNPRVLALTPDFNSSKSEIRFQVDLKSLSPASCVEGVLTICSELGEVAVPYSFTVREAAEDRKTVDTDSLTELAQTDFAAAAEVYGSELFERSLTDGRYEALTIRKALSGEEEQKHALEQFLIAEGKKDIIELSLSRETMRIVNPEGTVLEKIVLTKSTWGYMEISVSSDARFLRVEKKQLTTEDFIGSEWSLCYVIDSNFLHAGRNFGRITVHTCYQTLAFELCVEVRKDADLRSHRVQNVMIRRTICLYLDYRLGRIDLRQWTERTHSVIESYKRAGGKDLLADLLGVFVLMSDGKRASAERELRRIEMNPGMAELPNAQAVWLYLSTFFNRDNDYRVQVREQMRELSLQNRSSWLIQWLTLYLLEDEQGGDAGKLQRIVRFVEQFSASPILLLEGMQIVHPAAGLRDEEDQQECPQSHDEALDRIGNNDRSETTHSGVDNNDSRKDQKTCYVRQTGHSLDQRCAADELRHHLSDEENNQCHTAHDHHYRGFISGPKIVGNGDRFDTTGNHPQFFADHTQRQKRCADLDRRHPGLGQTPG